MILDFLTLLYILLIGGGIVLVLVLIRFLRNEVWVATVDDNIAHYFGLLKKDDSSGAAQIFIAGDTSEPAIGQVLYKESVGQILLKRESAGTGKNQYKKVGFVDSEGYLYRQGKPNEDPERIGYLAAPSVPNVPSLKGERTWRDFWWSCKLNAYLGNPEDYVAPPENEHEKKRGKKEDKKKRKRGKADTRVNEAGSDVDAPVHFASERIPNETNPRINAPLIQEIETAIAQAKEDLQKEAQQAVVSVQEKEVQQEVEQEVEQDAVAPTPTDEEPISSEEEIQLKRILENHQNVVKEIIGQLVFVKGGSFMMGADGPKHNVPEENTGYGVSENEGPVHKVTLNDYFIGRYPVTQRQWAAIMGYNPSENQEDPLYPVAPVNWDECKLFVKRVKRLTGLDICLPTEAQWEYAARGGNHHDSFIYSGSDLFSEVGCDSPYFEVGSKKPNSLGIYDMSGLVREWCEDWYEIHYTGDDLVNPKGPDTPPDPEDPRHVVRSPRGNDTVTNRKGELPTELPFKSYGLRIVCNSDVPSLVKDSNGVSWATKPGAEDSNTEKKPAPPVLIGQGIKTGWLSGDTHGCPLTLESRAAAFSALGIPEGEEYSEHIADSSFTRKDTALFSSVIFAIVFLLVYFINVGILEYPLLGNDLKAILIFSAFYFVIWACVRLIKIYSIENGHSIQPFFTLFNKSLGVKKLDRLILVLSIIAVPLCFFKFDADFIPLFIALILGTGINGMIRKNGKKWEVRNPLLAVQEDEEEGLYDRKTGLLIKPEGDVSVEFQWKLQSFTPGKELDCFLSFWYDRELIESERIMNPFYMEDPALRNKPSIFKAYVGKMIELIKNRSEMTYHLRYVVQEISRIADRNELSDIDRLQIILDFAQQAIDYVKDEESKTICKPYIYVRFPDETLFDKEGDCNCKAFLAGSMYYLMGYDVLYASSTKLGHSLIGLKLPPDILEQNGIQMNDGNSLEYNNSQYILCETTHSGFRIGSTDETDTASKYDVVVEFIHEYEEE